MTKSTTIRFTAPKRGWFGTFLATWAGRKDARRETYIDKEDHSAYTRILSARVHQGLAKLTEQLYEGIQSIDQELATLTAKIILLHNEKKSLDELTTTLGSELANPSSDEELAYLHRRKQATSARLDAIRQEEVALKAMVNERTSDRYLLGEQARSVAFAWINRYYKCYGEAYRRSFDAKDSDHRLKHLGELPTEFTWISEGIPFLVTITDAEQDRIIRSVLYHATELADPLGESLEHQRS
jgi:hypothetical protein